MSVIGDFEMPVDLDAIFRGQKPYLVDKIPNTPQKGKEPNMDKIPLQQKGTLVPVIAEIIGNFFKLDETPDPRSLAERYLNLSELKDYVETLMDASKPALIKSCVHELFPEYDLRVTMEPGRSTSAINTKELFNGLAVQNRTEDFFRVCSVTQKALGSLADGEALISKYKEVGESGAPFVKVSAITKAEWVKIQGSKA